MRVRSSRYDIHQVRITRYRLEDAVSDAELTEVLESHQQLLLVLQTARGG